MMLAHMAFHYFVLVVLGLERYAIRAVEPTSAPTFIMSLDKRGLLITTSSKMSPYIKRTTR